MKICWDNLEKVIYNKKGDFWRKGKYGYYRYFEKCKECEEPFLGCHKHAEFCSIQCVTQYVGREYEVTKETRLKLSKAGKGLKRSKETRQKMSISKIGNPSRTGMTNSPEARRKVSLKNKGKKRSEEFKRQVAERMRKLVGDKNPNWRGGVDQSPYCPIFSNKEWREYIFERDKEKQCWNPQCKGIIERECLHHINYNKKDCRCSNIIKICNGCNTQANFNRSWWKSFYKEIMRRRGLLNERRTDE